MYVDGGFSLRFRVRDGRLGGRGATVPYRLSWHGPWVEAWRGSSVALCVRRLAVCSKMGVFYLLQTLVDEDKKVKSNKEKIRAS